MSPPPRILHETPGLLVVEKPAGMLVVPGRTETTQPTVIQALSQARGERLFVVHRLDRDTTGVLVIARTAPAHRTLSMAFEAGRVRKRYRAICVGAVPESLEISSALVPARRGRMRVAFPGEEGKPALTRVRLRERFKGFSDVEVEPLTGRTHQIRVHLRSVEHPLAVDAQYGRPEPLTAAALGALGEAPVLTRTPLHAWQMDVPALEDGVGPFSIECPLPEDMQRTLALLRTAAATGASAG